MAMILLSAFALAMLLAAFSDLASMTIPNRLVVALAVLFPMFTVAAGLPLALVALHGIIGAAVLAIGFGCFAAGWIGGGDAKLIAAVALWLGPSAALASFALWTSILGGGLTLAFILARACLSPTTGLASVDRLLTRDAGIPYGVAIGVAGLLSAPTLLSTVPG